MTIKWGLTALIVGGFLVAFGLAGINATSGGTMALYAVVLVLGFVTAGWAVVLPWDGDSARRRNEHETPGPVPRP